MPWDYQFKTKQYSKPIIKIYYRKCLNLNLTLILTSRRVVTYFWRRFVFFLSEKHLSLSGYFISLRLDVFSLRDDPKWDSKGSFGRPGLAYWETWDPFISYFYPLSILYFLFQALRCRQLLCHTYHLLPVLQK